MIVVVGVVVDGGVVDDKVPRWSGLEDYRVVVVEEERPSEEQRCVEHRRWKTGAEGVECNRPRPRWAY